MSTKTQSHWLKAGVADEWVTQLLRQGDSRVFKKYSQMNLQMKNEALQKLERQQFNVFGSQPIRITRPRKLLLILRAWMRFISGSKTANYGMP